MKIKIAVMISGGGTNLQALINSQNLGVIKSGEISLVISSSKNAFGLVRAKNSNIPSYIVESKDYASNSEYENEIIKILNKNNIEVLVLAGYLKILSKEFISNFKGKIINIHPSLIPSFCGKGFYGLKVHEKALKYGVKVTGATVHYVNEVPDGGQIIMQRAVEVKENDTALSLQRRVMENAEWIILPKSVEKVCKEIMNNKTKFEPINKYLENKDYIGRGIIAGLSENGKKAVLCYFIMGRSENSQNRIFVLDNEDLYTKAFDETKVSDPTLIIYRATGRDGNIFVATNGDQTDTIMDYLNQGKTFEEALNTRTFEPDAPNFTPRISGKIDLNKNKYTFSILKSGDKEGNFAIREFFNFDGIKGQGHIIHTYLGDGDPLPSFAGEPREVFIEDNMEEFANKIWKNLNNEYKISLFIQYIDIDSKEVEKLIINKHC